MTDRAPRKSVLLADDVRDNVLLLESFLAGKYATISVYSAKEALHAMREVLFDAAVLDLNYPDLPVEEFISELEKIEKRPAIVVFTGLDLDRVIPLLQGLGPKAVLQKPTLGAKIMEVLDGVLGT